MRTILAVDMDKPGPGPLSNWDRNEGTLQK